MEKDKDKTKEQLISELEAARQRVSRLKASQAARKRIEEALQNERLRSLELFENLPIMPYHIGLDGTIRDCNHLVLETLGYENKEELVGKPLITTVYAPSSCHKAEELLAEWKKTGKIKNEEMQVITASGEIRDVLLSVDTIYGLDGKPLYSIYTQLDITARKRVEEITQENANQIRTIADNLPALASHSPVGIYIARKGKFIYTNRHFQRDTGYSEEELLGINCLDLVVPEDREKVRESAIHMLKGERRTPYEYRTTVKGGRRSWVLETVAPIQYRGARATLGNYQDITERKEADEQVRKSQEYLDRILNGMFDAVMVADFDYNVKDVNDRFVNTYNAAKENIIGRKCYELTHGFSAPLTGLRLRGAFYTRDRPDDEENPYPSSG
jgi:PAS domain S-box-containing protein